VAEQVVWAQDRSWLVGVHRFEGTAAEWSGEGTLFRFSSS
jgi:hypothetical protein